MITKEIEDSAKRAADAVGVTPHSDMRLFVEQAVKYALSTLPIAVEGKVKALEWKGPDSSGEYHSLGGLWGYIIRARTGSGYWLTEIGQYFKTVVDAKASAQAHYNHRILSALISSPGKDGGQEVEAASVPDAMVAAFQREYHNVAVASNWVDAGSVPDQTACKRLIDAALPVAEKAIVAELAKARSEFMTSDQEIAARIIRSLAAHPSPQSTVDADAVIERLSDAPLAGLINTNCTDVKMMWAVAAQAQRVADIAWLRHELKAKSPSSDRAASEGDQ